MRILFISDDLLAGNLALLMQQEGHEVKIYIRDPGRHNNLKSVINRVDNWRDELDWVGKDGLMVFDDVGFGKAQDELRQAGFAVIGGSELGDKLECDREFGHKIFKEYGIKTVPLHDFTDLHQAIEFIRQNPAAWVIKQNGDCKEFNYLGQFQDGSDSINVLENYTKPPVYPYKTITLQRRIYGVEIGIGRYFNGLDWVGPIEFNMEHKNLFPGNLGPSTFEMGTLAWYGDDESNYLYVETLAKLKPFLIKANFRGDISINCIVNQESAFPLEATARFGLPIIHLQTELNLSPWGEFLSAVARNQTYDLKYKTGYGIVVSVVAPPFPYHLDQAHPLSIRGSKVIFDPLIRDQLEHIHLDEVDCSSYEDYFNCRVTDDRGYLLYVTAEASTVNNAREKVYDILRHIHAPKMYYRNDIGQRFIDHDQHFLRELKII